MSVIPKYKKKTVLDAWNGYHSVPLSPESCEATIFITELGRYWYLRAPQGFHGSNDGYTKRYDDVTTGFPRVARCIDDSLLWNHDIAISFWHVMGYIRLCHENGVIFNPEKFRFSMDEVEFAGFDIDSTSYKPPARLMNAIRDFPSPTNITGIRSWFGLINQVSYAFAQAPIMGPFHEFLTGTGHDFYWDETLETIFQESKKVIMESIAEGVRTFEINRTTCLATDWSKTGIGFTLSQKHCSCPIQDDPFCGEDHWKVTYAGSRFTSSAESRYAPIEGEALALLFGLESCRMFVLGCPYLIIASDHQHLERIFNNKNLDEVTNPRVFKVKEKSLIYQFRVVTIPGLKNKGPDAMSRIPPTPHTKPYSSEVESSVVSTVNAILESLREGAITTDRIRKEAAEDNDYKDLGKTIEDGFPESKEPLPENLNIFWKLKDELYTVEDLVYADGRVLIPQKLKNELIEQLHVGHQCVSSMKAYARKRFFWPGMNASIQNKRIQCHRCN